MEVEADMMLVVLVLVLVLVAFVVVVVVDFFVRWFLDPAIADSTPFLYRPDSVLGAFEWCPPAWPPR